MANLKSAIKRVNTNDKKRKLNQPVRSDTRTHIKHVETLVEAQDAEKAQEMYNKTVKKIDKAVQKGVIHRNKGNRHKSRLAKKIQNLTA